MTDVPRITVGQTNAHLLGADNRALQAAVDSVAGLDGGVVEIGPGEHLRFRNLTFVHSRFELPRGNSNDQQGSARVPATVTLRGARHCAFEQCRLSNLGTFAFDVMTGCEENQLVGNEIAHVPAGGIRINGGTDRNPPWERTRNTRVTDNWLHPYGQDYPSGVGMLLMHAEGITVAHHHIHDVDAYHYGGWGIYPDEGSTHLLVDNNIVYWREGELLSKNWKDVPYTLHAHPNDKSGAPSLTNTLECDWNLYFNPTKTGDEVEWAGATWAEWQTRGKDRHSQYADPRFANPEQGDFTLRAESPAFAMGFQPIDLRQVGPRSKTGPQPK